MNRAATDRDQWLSERKRVAERAYAKALAKGYPREAGIFRFAAEQLIEHNNPAVFEAIGRVKQIPVTIDEFVESKEFIGDLMEIWPTLMPDLRLMNPDVFVGAAPCHEALLGGATGTGKTFLSQATNLYQLYLFTCFTEPQRMFNLTPATPIVFMLQSVSTTVTKRVIYTPFRNTFTSMPYALKWLTWDKYRDATLDIEGNLIVAPALASVQSMVGQAIPGGILDEVNFMQIVENSKQVPGENGMGGKFDQAEMVYRNISRRRKRSFLTNGISLGCLCVVSSTRYKGDFLDRRIDEVQAFNEQNIVCLRRKQYEVAPPGRYSGVKFRLLLGTDSYPTRVLEDTDEVGVHYPESAQIEMVPIELKVDFMRDPEAAQRDYIGLATDSITPFISQRNKIIEAVLAGRDAGLVPWVEKQDVDLLTDGMPQIVEAQLPADRSAPRYCHVDLSTSADRCGIGIVRPLGHTAVVNADNPELVEMLPTFAVELAVTIQPSPMKQLDIGDVRKWILQLINFWGINIVSVSYDGFQSSESIQLLRKAGVRAHNVSVDRTTEPYEMLRRAIYDGRVLMVDSDMLRTELSTLEFYAKRKKVDHPPKGCFVGETQVRLASSETITMAQLKEDADAGITHIGVSWDSAIGTAVFKPLGNPRITKFTDELIEVTLANGATELCTPDHRWLLKDGTYKEAQFLQPGDELQD